MLGTHFLFLSDSDPESDLLCSRLISIFCGHSNMGLGASNFSKVLSSKPKTQMWKIKNWSVVARTVKLQQEAKDMTSVCADTVPRAVHRPLHQYNLSTVQRTATMVTKMWTERYGKQIYCGQKHTVRPYTLMTRNAHSLIEASKLPVFPQWLRCSILFTRVWHREVNKNNCGECACVCVWERRRCFMNRHSDIYTLTTELRINS